MQQIEQRAFLHQLHHQAQLRRDRDGSEHEHDIWVAVLGQHVDLIVELPEQFLADVGVEHLLDRHFHLQAPPAMDCAEPAHRNLLSDLEVAHPQRQHAVHRLALGLHLHSLYFVASPPETRLRARLRPEDVRVPGDGGLFALRLLLLHQPARRLGLLPMRRLRPVLPLKAQRQHILQVIRKLDVQQRLEPLPERVSPEGQGGQLGELHDLLGQVVERIVFQVEHLEPEQLGDGRLDAGDFIVIEVQLLKRADAEDILRDEGQLTLG